jgi:hypothetical protein
MARNIVGAPDLGTWSGLKDTRQEHLGTRCSRLAGGEPLPWRLWGTPLAVVKLARDLWRAHCPGPHAHTLRWWLDTLSGQVPAWAAHSNLRRAMNAAFAPYARSRLATPFS